MTATVDHERDSHVFEPSADEFRTAVQRALVYAGVGDFDELQAQATSGRFTSSRARRAWVAIGGLRKYS